MKIIQWLRPDFGYNVAVGYDVNGDRAEYTKMKSWCIEHFGKDCESYQDDYRWGSNISGWSTMEVEGCFHFKNEEDGMAFKLRWC